MTGAIMIGVISLFKLKIIVIQMIVEISIIVIIMTMIIVIKKLIV